MFIRKLFKETAIYGGSDLFGKIVSFFIFPIIAATLGLENFGYLDLILTVVSLLGIIVSCGLTDATYRYYWDEKTQGEDRSLLIFNGLSALTLFCLILIILSFVIVPIAINHPQYPQLPFSAYAIFSAVILVVTTQVIRYALETIRLQFAPYKFMTTVILGRVMAALLSVYAVVYLHAGIDGLLITQVIAGLMVIPIVLYFIKKDIVFKLDRKWLKALLSYGYPLIFANIAFWLFGAIDRWMLAYFDSVVETGIYAIAFRLSTIVLFISIAIGGAWKPYTIKIKTEKPDVYREIYSHMLLLFYYVMLFFGGFMALFSGEIVSLLFPESYVESAIPLSILCFAIVLQATQQVTIMGISIEKKTHLLARIAWGTALLNFVLNLILIPEYGAAGAAFATLLTYFGLTAFYLFYTQKLHPIPIAWKKTVFFLALGGVLIALSIWGNNPDIDVTKIMQKLLGFLVIMFLGLWVLPIKKLKQLTA